MKSSLALVLLALTCIGGLAGCAERPQRVVASSDAPYNVENGVSPMRERTLRQGETRRMSY